MDEESFNILPLLPNMSLPKILSPICLLWGLVNLSAAVMLRDPSTINRTYDYIVAGGGLTGLVVANRLTENSNSKCCPVSCFSAVDD